MESRSRKGKGKKIGGMAMVTGIALFFSVTFMSCGTPQSQISSFVAQSWEEQYDLGMRYLQEGNYEEAIIAFTQAISIDAKQPAIYLAKAQAYEALGMNQENYERALADYKKAQELGSTEEEVWIGLSNACLREGDLFGAMDILKQGLEALGKSELLQERLDSLQQADSALLFPGGHLQVRTWGTGDGACSAQLIMDDNNCLLSAFMFLSSGEPIGTIPVERDENGNHTKGGYVMELAGEYSVFSVERKFDSENHLLEEAIFGPDGEKQGSTRYSYGETGMCVRVEEYDGQDNLLQYCDFVEYIDPEDEEATGNMGVVRYEGQATAEPVPLKGTMYLAIAPESKIMYSFEWNPVDYQFREKYNLSRQFEYAQEGERMVYVGYNVMAAAFSATNWPNISTIA